MIIAISGLANFAALNDLCTLSLKCNKNEILHSTVSQTEPIKNYKLKVYKVQKK